MNAIFKYDIPRLKCQYKATHIHLYYLYVSQCFHDVSDFYVLYCKHNIVTLLYTESKGHNGVMEMSNHSTLQCWTVRHFHDLAWPFAPCHLFSIWSRDYVSTNQWRSSVVAHMTIYNAANQRSLWMYYFFWLPQQRPKTELIFHHTLCFYVQTDAISSVNFLVNYFVRSSYLHELFITFHFKHQPLSVPMFHMHTTFTLNNDKL